MALEDLKNLVFVPKLGQNWPKNLSLSAEMKKYFFFLI